MTQEQIKIFNSVLSVIVNRQTDLSQPLYVIAKYWCGRFDGIETVFTEDGDKDLEEIKKIFDEKYAWKEGMFGVTERSYKLIRVDLTSVLDGFGNEIGGANK